ncbi:N [Taro vein chlorosis virus]|uniref:Nucleoprotein n=1 Tax=Taro vein chlorosis virus TaxID=2749935 RepID=NCAP_TAVCV|nr:N [Taro vein chlorosis virus] [Taro vein chlorosis virus]Q5GA90.1 RecName: Full=Nucleoprotein; Short=NP; AltName: Full=Nucleocapsid protein; Short=Protein N [Alphanucleorhabdovirus colocasiae]AAV92082.1 N [Taro vein chlorosis virus] [Taro vein chlorosis virus]
MSYINIPDDVVSKYSDDLKTFTQKAGEIPSSKSLIPQTAYTIAALKTKLKFWEVTAKDDPTIASDWAGVCTAITAGTFSATNLKTVCELAFNLRKPHETGNVFIHTVPSDWTSSISTDSVDTTPIPATESDATLSTVSAAVQSGAAEDAATKAKAISFLCCALIRLSVKEPSHIMTAITSIRQRFGSLYGLASATLNAITFTRQQLSRIKQGIETYSLARGTIFYYVRYADTTYGSSDKSYGVCRFLLFQHLELEGMHIYKMILALLTEWSTVPIGLLLTWIRNPKSALAVVEIKNIITNFDKAGVDKSWKYSRMIDNTFFLNISSRRNVYMCALLASLNKRHVPQGVGDYADPRNIAVIKAMDAAVKNQVAIDVTLVERIYEKYLISAGSTDAGTAYTLSRGTKRPNPAVFMSHQQAEGHPTKKRTWKSMVPPPPTLQLEDQQQRRLSPELCEDCFSELLRGKHHRILPPPVIPSSSSEVLFSKSRIMEISGGCSFDPIGF